MVLSKCTPHAAPCIWFAERLCASRSSAPISFAAFVRLFVLRAEKSETAVTIEMIAIMAKTTMSSMSVKPLRHCILLL